jgi:hypothetical protein
MVWFLLGIAPFVAALIWGLVKAPDVVFFVLGFTAAVFVFLLIAFYGVWDMHWFPHCGGFWQSMDCTGKEITR